MRVCRAVPCTGGTLAQVTAPLCKFSFCAHAGRVFHVKFVGTRTRAPHTLHRPTERPCVYVCFVILYFLFGCCWFCVLTRGHCKLSFVYIFIYICLSLVNNCRTCCSPLKIVLVSSSSVLVLIWCGVKLNRI